MKDGVFNKVVCERDVCERWCVTKLCVKYVCVGDVCERWCVCDKVV